MAGDRRANTAVEDAVGCGSCLRQVRDAVGHGCIDRDCTSKTFQTFVLGSLPNCVQAVFVCYPSRAAAGALVFLHTSCFATLPQAFVGLRDPSKSWVSTDAFQMAHWNFLWLFLFRLRRLCAGVIEHITANLPKIHVLQARPSTRFMIAWKCAAIPLYEHYISIDAWAWAHC